VENQNNLEIGAVRFEACGLIAEVYLFFNKIKGQDNDRTFTILAKYIDQSDPTSLWCAAWA
jgi:hypothetical protein